MSVEEKEEKIVLIGYTDENDEYYGFLGSLKVPEYVLLKKLSEKCKSSSILSIDELETLSDIKNLIAKTQIKLFDYEKDLSNSRKRKLEKVNQAIGNLLKSFDVFRDEAPQLDFILSFCIIDAEYCEYSDENEYESKNFHYVNPDTPGIWESFEAGLIEYMAVSHELFGAIYEWIELDGRRIFDEAQNADTEAEWKRERGAIDVEIDWWRDNIAYFEDCEYEFTTMLFRAIRNNILKSKRRGESVLSERDWSKRIEIL